jgi:tRNA nucleotidyltransferase (CCA-adding enzyme)
VLKGESPAFVYFALWLAPLSPHLQTEVMDRLVVRKATREDVDQCQRVLLVLQELPADPKSSEVERALRPIHPRVLLAARALLGDSPQTEWLIRYYEEWRHIKTIITGDDLRALGLKPSPRYATLLDQLLAARLDGLVADEAEERALLQQLLEK